MKVLSYIALALASLSLATCTPGPREMQEALAFTCVPKLTFKFTPGDLTHDELGHEVETGKLEHRLELCHSQRTLLYNAFAMPFQLRAGEVYTFMLNPMDNEIQKALDASSQVVWERTEAHQDSLKFIGERSSAQPPATADREGAAAEP